jgi:16S rRNA (guanine(966)-N(2))-methyltransferase RsmD
MRQKRSGRSLEEETRGQQVPSALSSVTKHDHAPVTRPQHLVHAPRQVRIVGGRWKRTPLPVPDLPGLRPTPDRVRETLFNWIAQFFPALGAVRGLDLFAGTGALGFELASRGARSVMMVESQRAAFQSLQATRARLAAAQVELIAGDAFAVAARLPDASFDIILLDPPFDAALQARSLDAARRLISPTGMVYLEAPAPLAPVDAQSAGLEVVRSGRAGRVAFHLLQPVTG